MTQLDRIRSHWEAPIPGGLGTVTWDTTIVEERDNELLSWQSDADANINKSGVVEFRPAPHGQGTELHSVIKYLPPAGELGKGVASLLNPALGRMAKEDMRRFQQYLETGEISDNRSDYGNSFTGRIKEALL